MVDVSGFIASITAAIWNGPGRDPGLCERYYAPAAPIHTEAGDIVGGAAVTANTRERLRAFPDFHGVIDDTVWTGDAAGGFRTSMRWTWTGTHTGPHPFAAATGRTVRFGAIADCVVHGEVITEEWLTSNPRALAAQLGIDDAEAARRRPTPARSAMTSWPAAAESAVVRPDGAVATVLDVLRAGVGGADVTDAYAPGAPVTLGPGRAADAGWLAGWARLLGAASVRIEDAFARAGADGADRVATRWTVLGPDGPVVTAGSHHHVRDGRITAEWTHYDEIAVLARAGGLP